MKRLFLFLLIALGWSTAQAADPSCASQLGRQRAELLARQCRLVSPATRPPCNAANSCALVVGEMERGCAMLEGESYQPAFCKPAPLRTASLGTKAILLGGGGGGGGGDDAFVTVLSEDGRRLQAYCLQQCGALFEDGAEGETLRLREALVGKPVQIRLAVEGNGGRVAGADGAERLVFVKRLRVLE